VAIQTLWHTRAEWISDPFEWVFLPRAMLEIGAALFPGEWTGHEPEEWAASRRDSRGQADRALPAVQLFERVCSEVTTACKSGEVAYGLRLRDGGKVLTGPPEWWNTEGAPLHHRFSRFSFDPGRPFQCGASQRDDWICISRGSLEKFLSKRPHANAAALAKALNVPHLSPYLAHIIQVASKLKITPENQLTKDAIEAELRPAWPKSPRDDDPSKNLIEAAATLMREPQSQLGRAKKSSSK
jgi:hypothetical protein